MFQTNLTKVLGVFSITLVLALSATSCKCDKKNVTTTASDSTNITPTSTIAGKYDSLKGWIYDVGASKEITLPNGVKLNVGEKSSEATIVKLLNDATYNPADTTKKTVWTSLDRVYFETGKDVLTAESETQVKNIAEIMKAYPKAVLKLGGYTDNTGAADLNKKLSDARAKAVVAKLVAMGIPATNVSGEGYGSGYPVCAANDTPECKAQNRRVDIRVKSK